MRKAKTYHPNHAAVCHAWAHQVAPHGQCGGNVSFDGDMIYSYGYFTMARFVEPIGPLPRDLAARFKRVCLVTSDKYSMTTSAHVSMMRRALPDSVLTFTIPNPATDKDNAAYLAVHEMVQVIVKERERLLRARVRIQWGLDNLSAKSAKLALFMRVFRRELTREHYQHAEALHTGMGYPVKLNENGQPMNAHIDSPIQWMQDARRLIKYDGVPCDAERLKLRAKITREEKREADAIRVRRMERASVMRAIGRPFLRALREHFPRNAMPEDALSALETAGVVIPGADTAHAYGGTVYGWGLSNYLPNRANERWTRYLMPVVALIVARRTEERTRLDRMNLEERQAVERVELEKWTHGEPTSINYFGSQPMRARIQGAELVSSQGASVPIEHARRLARIWRHRNSDAAGQRIGHFQVDREQNGSLVIGCHRFDSEEVARIACLLLDGVTS